MIIDKDKAKINMQSSSVVTLPADIDLFQVFQEGFDRFDFPGPVYRVTGGHGGEAILVCGSEKTALVDCGMAYCAEVTVANVIARLAALGREGLDYILLSHSHYDHIGALPYLRQAFPEVCVVGSRHCSEILLRPNAHRLMKELGENALQLYEPGSTREISVEGLSVDLVVEDGDRISLGNEWVECYETRGHTDCSMSFFVQPLGLLFTSESTGIIEGTEYVHTPVLKDFTDAGASLDKCRALAPKHVCLPHYGMIPDSFITSYWNLFEEECRRKFGFVREMIGEGLDEAQMFDRYVARYWTSQKEMEQPKEAFMINSKYILKAILKELNKYESVHLHPVGSGQKVSV